MQIEEARQQVAEYTCCQTEQIVFVENASTGVNTVLRGIDWQPGVYLFDLYFLPSLISYVFYVFRRRPYRA